ncbi:hypothetical protein DFQ28_002965 [Apophysomyces sp. BC1034]|nr:hypothetical protein DFQ30_004141 [Apophysomyces sp. BC1015]KAG0183632.1 hypothetical protein DFQ29_000057 [Apophysomyces sp. BC1021]KAG0194890.1 hypothetical protein DFQ28_002965 [Apophysomyces sp. BC1034]
MQQLPYEILSAIILLLAHEQTTLASITCVSKKLRQISLAYLYRRPAFHSVDRFRDFTANLTEEQAQFVSVIDLQLTPHRWSESIGPALCTLAQKAKYIKRLDIGFCKFAVGQLPSLQYLSTNGCRKINDTVVEHITANCPQLRGLDLSASVSTDKALYSIGNHCQHLATLDISQCEQVSEAGLLFLRKKCSRLRSVNVKDCYNIVGDIDWESGEEEGWETEGELDEEVQDVIF